MEFFSVTPKKFRPYLYNKLEKLSDWFDESVEIWGIKLYTFPFHDSVKAQNYDESFSKKKKKFMLDALATKKEEN